MSGMAASNVLPRGSSATDDLAPSEVDSSYTHPLEVSGTSFKLYGESTTYTKEDAGHIFSSAKMHSYDPAILFNDLRQEGHQGLLNPTGGLGAGRSGDSPLAADDPETAARATEEEESDAVMRSGRNKQGAAGAAAMAAAMLDSRRAAEGIAMVPGHPLPVVFPRSDGLSPAPRVVKKLASGGLNEAHAGPQARQTRQSSEEDVDAIMCGEVMESERHVESHSLQRSITWRVQVLDEHCKPTPIKHFQHFREAMDVLPARVMQGLSESGLTRPTLFQSAAIPQLMCGRDVVGIAPDGSGTTVAYALLSMAVLVKVKAAQEQKRLAKVVEEGTSSAPLPPEPSEAPPSSSGAVVAHPIVVVLCTNRQTVLLTAAMYSSLGGEDVRLVAAYQSVDADDEDSQRSVIRRKKGCDVIVATPARLTALVREGHVALSRVHVLVVDRANHLLAVDPSPNGRSALQHVEDIMHAVKENGVAHQFSLWCTELGLPIESLVRKYMSPLTVTVMATREEHTNVNVREILYPLPSRDDRIKAIQQLYDQGTILKRDQVLVYCAYRETAEEVRRELIKALSAPSSMVQCVHSGLRCRKRNELLKAFQHGDIRILVATDVATKRLDVEELKHVIHYDLPAFTEVYKQRVSQVDRSGRQGTSHTFLTPGDTRVPPIARFVEKQTDHALNDEIRKMIADIEAAAGEDSWATPVLRMHGHAVSNTKWRVRGRREIRQQVETLSGLVSESDETPVG
ncbi:putative DEAD/DEAH box helicase [Leishmania major strain Friedlin]|uniref:RNA helicase n=1 Tax=Leishmania major TaxID=5664 RepID=Q4QHK6_LEIMA|nr:putative DEAD/DEAH box helicase [Leishmania major strain Friedlin]CAG9569986.1 DEAD/DEAH_box_helicase_-_putative [Leishmania major strain Friedlin]CAJ02378.1 putative DEAD/DEAH box helicase [Leishmania major strain Friedlin]|eukprot:XP_001681342.1 putative DEAD/DEAH box helicase [Leishmania major strain Friedlin]